MPMHATVMGSNVEPLSNDFEIIADDFDEAEAAARQIADSGTKCCIRWHRTNDGQVGYWGPSGATLKPHWYAKLGRPFAAPGATKSARVELRVHDDTKAAWQAKADAAGLSLNAWAEATLSAAKK